MSTRILSFSIAAFLIGIALPVAFALTPPAWLDEEYRNCMSETIDREMEEKIQAQRDYNDQQIRDLEEYRSDLQRAWQISDDKSRRDELREVDRRYRDADRAADRAYAEEIREIRSRSRDTQRECRNRLNDNRRFTRNLCYSTQDCSSNQVCSTERGVCDPSCPSDAEACQQVCAGTCERASRSASSRSSGNGNSSRFSTGQNSSRVGSSGNRPWEDYQSNGQVCNSSAACPSGYFCSTNLGECNQSCAPGFEQCVQVCAGTCLLYPINPPASAASSRFSTGQGSSRSGIPGVNCTPYQCPDGRDVPSCDENGNPINYVQNPCYS
jgi:hypothetical protein